MTEELKELLSQRLFITHELLKGSTYSNETRQLILESQKSLDSVIQIAIKKEHRDGFECGHEFKNDHSQQEINDYISSHNLKNYNIIYRHAGENIDKIYTVIAYSSAEALDTFGNHFKGENVEISKIELHT